MLAAKIVRFSEERGEGEIGRRFRLRLHFTITSVTPPRIHYLQPHARKKRRPTLNRKPPFIHFTRLDFEYVKKQRLLARMYFSYFAALNTQASHQPLLVKEKCVHP